MSSEGCDGSVTPDGRTTVAEGLNGLVVGARYALFDFDGPICRLFAMHGSDVVADDLRHLLEERGAGSLLPPDAWETNDPHVVLGAVHRVAPDTALLAELEQRLTEGERKAAATAWPTPYADILVRTLSATGRMLAVVTNNAPEVAAAYLASRGLAECFGPHIYGRTNDPAMLKPHPDSLHRALDALGAKPHEAWMIGDTPTDRVAADRAKVRFIGYARNEAKAERLLRAGSGLVVGTLEPVLKAARLPPSPVGI